MMISYKYFMSPHQINFLIFNYYLEFFNFYLRPNNKGLVFTYSP